MTLFEIRLPAGDTLGFDIAGQWDNGSRRYIPTWLAQGHTGVRFIGAGRGRTHIRPAPGVWTNIGIDAHPGTVRLESLTLHGRGRSAMQAGRPMDVIQPKFSIEWEDFELVADEQVEGRVFWGGFFYGANTKIKNGEVWWGPAAEHPFYHHSSAGKGFEYRSVVWRECAAQAIKVRTDPREVRWAGKGQLLDVEGCRLLDWNRPHSNRGGAGIVCEGGGTRIRIVNNEFVAPRRTLMDTRCIMIDDGNGNFYDPVTGRVGVGHANGDVVIKGNGMSAGPGTENLSIMVRVGALGSGQKAARSLLMEGNGMYGRNLQLQVGDIPTGKTVVRGNNTPSIQEIAQARGYDVEHECLIPLADHTIPVSQGIVR